jgi:hypothetical protein
MKLSYTLTLADFKAAFRLHRRQFVTERMIFVLCLLLTIVCMAIPLLLGPNSQLSQFCVSVGWIFLSLSILLPTNLIYQAHRSYKQSFPSARTERISSTEIDDEQILTTIPGVSETKYLWNGVVGFAQNETVTLLYRAKHQFLLIPTRAFSPEQRTELNDLVARNLVRKQK